MARPFAVGRQVTSLQKMRQVREEIRARLDKQLSEGIETPVWGAGVFVRHVALGLFDRVSLCGRYVGDLNTQPMPTLIGVTCPRCIGIWNRAMDKHNAETTAADEAAITALADQMDELLGTGDVDGAYALWQAQSARSGLRPAVIDRLDERGVDLLLLLTPAVTRQWDDRA